MSDFPPPPPAPPRNPARVSSANTPAPATGWKANLKTKGKAFGKVAYEKSWKWSDSIGGKVNDYAEKAGSERFWPTTGDFQKELDKCERILHTFTVDGVATTVDAADPDNTSTKKKKPVKVLRKIPPEVIQQAVGLAIYTNFRTAIAPFGGSSGTGMVVARLPDGTWSPPSSISPNNYAAGLVYGVDIFDAIVVIRTQKALESFYTHKATLGADIGVVAGPFGAGAVAEVGKERAPVFSYVKSRGLYAGVSILGQIFVERFEENGAMYHWPGVKAKDILTGKVRMPVEAAGLMKQLKDSETGKAQREKGDGLDIVVPEGVDQLDLQEGEVLKLPPTPDMVDPEVGDDDPEASVISRRSSASHTAPRAMPPPLPKRFQSSISSASEYSEPERPETGYTPAAIEHTNAYPISGIDMGGVGINEMDESTRREHEQYLQALKESEAEHAALQNDKRHSNSTISGPPEYHSDVAPPTNPQVLASDAELQSGMSNLNVNATPVIPQETVYQAQHEDDRYDLR